MMFPSFVLAIVIRSPLPLRKASATPSTNGALQIRSCVPDTLGSEAFRKHQVFNFDEGSIKQPFNNNLCLTATDSFEVQRGPRRGMGWGIQMQPCSPSLAANQTWALNEHGNIVLTSLGMCIDIAGYATSSGSAGHIWQCTLPGKNPCSPSTKCPSTACTCVANQEFQWAANGNVLGLMSGLCMDVGSQPPPKLCDPGSPMRNASWSRVVCNSSLSPDIRAAALVAEANVTEQIANLAVGAPGFPRLGVSPAKFGEALHGVVTSCGKAGSADSTGCATSFPHATALAATFNRSLWSMVGEVIGIEGRALHNQEGGGGGIAYFAPNVNLYRDPRWGRGMEVPGEDPLLAGEYGARFVKAMQARSEADGRQQRVVCAPKHWLDYDLEGRHDAYSPGWGPSRNDFDAVVSKQEQLEYFLPQWHAMITQGQPGGVMCSTNRINGVDTCMNKVYLEGFLRKRFNFTGFVVTDGNSCGNTNCRATVALTNKSAATEWGTFGHELAAAGCLTAGTDVELGQTLTTYTAPALAAGLVPAADISRSNARLYAQMISQGHLESGGGPNDVLGPKDVDTPHSRRMAFEAATAATVLLKNDGSLLPLKPKSGLKIAVIGPHLNSTADLLSSHGYAGQNKLISTNTIMDAVQRRVAAGDFRLAGAAGGCNIATGCLQADVAAVTEAVADADVVIAFVGLHPATGSPAAADGYGTACSEGEAWDRGDISLCGQQPAILEAALKGAKGKGKEVPLVTVMVNGGTISASWIKQYSTAVLEGWYPGQSGGEALMAVLVGEANPGGRLPVTIYDEGFVRGRNSTGHNITDMSLRSGQGVTYMHYKGDPLWPFGFGLAYTTYNTTLKPTSATTTTTTTTSTPSTLTPTPATTNNTALAATTADLAAAYKSYYSPRGMAAKPVTSITVTIHNTGLRASDVTVLVFATAAATATATATATSASTSTPASTVATATPTATPTHTATPTPTATPSATPTATPTANSPLSPLPLRQLAGFERTAALGVGESRDVRVDITPLALCRVDGDGNQWAEAGEWHLAATVDGVTMVNATLAITGVRQQVLSWPTETGV